jgi:hypothetical protein
VRPSVTPDEVRTTSTAQLRARSWLGDPAWDLLSGTREFWRLRDDELEGLLALAREADYLQLKLVVPEEMGEATCAALDIDLAVASTRRVYFLDTPDLVLDRYGVVVRVRSIEREPDDSVIKLRPVVPRELPHGLRHSKRFVVEIDGMPGNYVCSGALKARLGIHDVERTIAGERPLDALFSKRQLALLAAHAPAGLRINDLGILGPIAVRRCKVVPDGLGRALAVELWTYPNSSRILELSTRCPADQARRVAAQTAATLRALGVSFDGAQRTKTRATLDFFGTTRPAAARNR